MPSALASGPVTDLGHGRSFHGSAGFAVLSLLIRQEQRKNRERKLFARFWRSFSGFIGKITYFIQYLISSFAVLR